MKIGEYKQMMSFLLRPKHIHHGTKIVQGVPYVPKGYATGGIIQSNYLKNFIQENKGVSNLEKAKKLNELGYTNSKGKPITDSYLEKFTKLNPEIKGFGKKVSNFSIDELKQYARPKQIQELESGLIDEDTFRKRVLQTRGDLNRTPEQISERYKKSYQNIINDPERLAKREQSNFEYRQRQYLEKGMYPPAQSPKDDLWKDFLKSADKNDRFSLVDEKPNKISRDIFENLKIKDNKTGDILTYDNVDKINPEQYQETIKPYEAKWQIKQSDLPSDLKNQITYVRGPGGNTRNIVIQHNEGIGKNPWNTSLTFQNENNAEYKIRSNFEKQFNNAETLSDKKEAIKSFAQALKEKAPNTISQPGKKIYGEEKDLNQLLETAFKDNPNALSQIKQIFKKSGIEDAEQAEALFKINNSLSSGLNPEMFKVLYPNTYQVASDAFSKISNVIKQNPSSIITGPLKGSLKLLNEAFPYIATAEAGLKIGFEGENPIRAIAETTIPFSEDILHHRDIINNLTPEGKKVYQKNIEDEARNQYSYIEGVPQQIQQRSPEEIEKTRNELDKYMQEAEQKTQEQKEQKIKDIQEKFQNMPDYMNYNTPIGAADGGHITRTNYAGGGEAGLAFEFLKKLRNISDSIRELKNNTHMLGYTARSEGITKAAEEALTPYAGGFEGNKHETLIKTIQNAKEHLPKEYHGVLDDMKSYADKHAYDFVDDMAKALDKTIDPNLKFENLPKNMFPMEDPLNNAFIIIDPEKGYSTGRYTFSTTVDPKTGRGTREIFDTFDPTTRNFLKREDWKPVGIESLEKGKEGLN